MAKHTPGETIIRWKEGNELAAFFTSNRKLKARFKKYEIEPIEEDGSGFLYEVPVNYIRVVRPGSGRQWTEEEREAVRERLAGARAEREAKKNGKVKPGKTGKPTVKASPARASDDDEDEDEDEEEPVRRASVKTKPTASAVLDVFEDDDDEDEEDEAVEVVRRKTTTSSKKGGTAKNKKRR